MQTSQYDNLQNFLMPTYHSSICWLANLPNCQSINLPSLLSAILPTSQPANLSSCQLIKSASLPIRHTANLPLCQPDNLKSYQHADLFKCCLSRLEGWKFNEAMITIRNNDLKSCIYISKGYMIMSATATVNTYLPWLPRAARHK
jgi:hypothetical protein